MDGEEEAYSEEEFVEEDDASSTRSITPAAEVLVADAAVPHVSPSGSRNAGEGAASPEGSHGTPERDATPSVGQTGAEVAADLGSSSQESYSILPGTPLHDGVEANENKQSEGREGGSTGNCGGLHAVRIGRVLKHASMPSLGVLAVGMEQEAQTHPGVRRGSAPSAISLDIMPSVREQVNLRQFAMGAGAFS